MYFKLPVGFGSREVAEAGVQKQLLGGTRGDSGLDEREWLSGLTGGRPMDFLRSGVGKWGRRAELRPGQLISVQSGAWRSLVSPG